MAALCHDLGHPPFVHNGEKALDDCMKRFGGFEGNAQTLRILSRLEKRESPTAAMPLKDRRIGLNLTARVLASVLKYDRMIPRVRGKSATLCKGYYKSERELVNWFKKMVVGQILDTVDFKTVECQIMDLADDIAYSTYDLEDAFKAGFLTPLDILTTSDEILKV